MAQDDLPRLGQISAVVCNYNGMAYLERCVSALVAEGDRLAEIVVVDNLSTDGSREFLAQRFPSVRVIAMPDNGGPARARNQGLREAKSRWVLTLDNDAIVTPGMLERLVEAARDVRRPAVLQPRSVFASEPSRVHYDGGFLHYAGLIALRNFYAPVAEAVGHAIESVDVAIAVCLLLDKTRIMALGGYDERYFILFEDLDLSMKLRRTGQAILSVEDAIVLHEEGTAGISFREGPSYPKRRVFFHSRNRWLYLMRCHRARTLLVSAPGLALYEAFWLAFAIKQGAFGAWLSGKWAFLRLWGESLAQRRRLGAKATVSDRHLLRGGPLTVTPAVARSGWMRYVVRLLDGGLQAWWALARHVPW
ncbi:MAG: glycosyltransferase family 2 protein [Planctomycetes bacterium]|nr:glycosyltransferase family 2 protein [Planctomycetota bacterium]MCB9910550.1 glycosyltransferase family 2 protein [Planctomycetota bacterium]HPF15405.1 glycosyltransferase family 2 protein [Planctomycetota bacterium]HRV82000.1 glycosyltransferase family 2 protein [Planctomycetota bacterium]